MVSRTLQKFVRLGFRSSKLYYTDQSFAQAELLTGGKDIKYNLFFYQNIFYKNIEVGFEKNVILRVENL